MLLKEKLQYKAAIYIRLSKEDGDKTESNSITNQRELIKSYLQTNTDISFVSERVDDGYSGVTFNRPAFNEMMADIKNGTINCVIVKDLSRFGRNYIETGRYIEQIFPFMGVRFIAINDNIDSANTHSQTNNIILPFKNLMNDCYCLDLSIKMRTQIALRQKQGEFVGPFAVYGYLRSSTDKNKLVVDNLASSIVKEIFAMRIAGHNNHYIAKHLNTLGVPSPLEYKKLLNLNFSTPFKVNPIAKWSHASINRILHNETYTGVLLQGKETTLNYKVKKRIKNPPENWTRVENTHDAIISKNDFLTAQNIMLRDTRTPPKESQLHLLSGLMKCSDCTSNMVRKKINSNGNSYTYYVCSKNKADKNTCSSHRISEQQVEKTLLPIITHQINLLSDMKKLTNQTNINYDYKNKSDMLTSKQKELERYTKLRLGIYEDYTDKMLTQSEYFQMKNHYEKICSDIQTHIELLSCQLANSNQKNTRFEQLNNLTKLSRTILVLLIYDITVFDSKTIKVTFNYKNEFETALNLLTNKPQTKDNVCYSSFSE